MEDSLICTPYPRKFLFQGVFDDPPPPPPLGIPKIFKWGLLTTLGNSKWFWYFKKRKWILTRLRTYNRILLQQSIKKLLLSSLFSQTFSFLIMSLLFLCKLVNLNILNCKVWNVNFSTILLLLWCKRFEENLSFTHINNFANDSKKSRNLQGSFLVVYSFLKCGLLDILFLPALESLKTLV